jgi:outer membrane protein OmpA-like peptidoglycan-associated protein
MTSLLRITMLTLALLAFSAINAQYASPQWGYGIEVGAARGDNSASGEDWVPKIRGDVQMKIAPMLLTQFGVSYAKLSSGDYSNQLLMGDARLLFRPFPMNQMFPFLYGGFGMGKNNGVNGSDFLPVVPVGVGVQTMLGQQLILQVSGGYNLVLSDDLDGIERTDDQMNRFTNQKQDGFFEIMVGLLYASPTDNPPPPKHRPPTKVLGDQKNLDTDGDGLNDDIELSQYKTDPKLADTDGDGLKDGEEVLEYLTDPLKSYTDADKLTDGAEILRFRTDPKIADTDSDGLNDDIEISQYKTDPNKADTDGDGLNDAQEVQKYQTDPFKADTDGDKISDGDEATKYRSDPIKADSDGDGVADGDEVLQFKTDPGKADTDDDGLNDYTELNYYHTDPIKIDSDRGGMNDGAEIKASKNPLDASDDLYDLSKGKKIVLHGINFEFNKSTILPDSKPILEKVRASLAANPEVTVTISGHTDNAGSDEYNRTLSQQRAQAVKDWLVANKINANRMKVIGKGETEPTSTNDTEEGRAENRRIEFMVE